jgi:hypothetical protein
MKSLKSSCKVCLGVAAGIVLGVYISHVSSVRAGAQESGRAHVFIYPVMMFDAKTAVPSNPSGARIAGISCIAKPTEKLPDAAVCYVATALN